MTRQPQIVGNCAQCSAEFKFKQSRPRKFCGNECARSSKPSKAVYDVSPRTCSHCSTTLTWDQRGNQYCGSKCAAAVNNSIRTEETRDKRKTIAETAERAPKLKDGIDYCEVFYSPVTGVVYHPKLKPATGWDDSKRIKSATVLSSMFSFELGKTNSEDRILSAIEQIKILILDGWSPSDIRKKFNIQYSDFGMFLKSSLGLTLKTRKDASNNFRKRTGTARVGRAAYRAACQFKFNPYLIETIPGYQLLKTNGMYSARNKNGVSRDHMISVEYGWRNNIDPAILSHPANCEFLLAVDNSTKSSACSMSIDQLMERIKTGDYLAKINEFITLPKSDEHRKKISEAVSRQRKITNGFINKTINKDDPIPDGFRIGFTRKKK